MKLPPWFAGLLPLTLIFSLLFISCLDDAEDEVCFDFKTCSSEKPTVARLDFKLSEHLEEIEVRRGRAFETGTLVWHGAHSQGLVLPLGWYAARARYVKDGDTVLALDGGELSYSESENCNETCYEPEHVTLDLALKPSVWER